MTFIIQTKGKIIDIMPGCWQDHEDRVDNLWHFYREEYRLSVVAYCVDHNCADNENYKPDWYIRKENR